MSPNAPEDLRIDGCDELSDEDESESPVSVAELEMDEERRFHIHRQTVLAHSALQPRVSHEWNIHPGQRVRDGARSMAGQSFTSAHAATDGAFTDARFGSAAALWDAASELDEEARFRIHARTRRAESGQRRT